jgi:hypothetical protein
LELRPHEQLQNPSQKLVTQKCGKKSNMCANLKSGNSGVHASRFVVCSLLQDSCCQILLE